jgi:hypothetical protein
MGDGVDLNGSCGWVLILEVGRLWIDESACIVAILLCRQTEDVVFVKNLAIL